MQKFYTNAIEYGNSILVRGYDESGREFNDKIKYKPRLFVPSNKENASWQNIYGDRLDSVDFDSMADAKDFIKRYEDVKNFSIYGLPRFLYPYLNEAFPGEIKYDKDLLNIAFIDIEVSSEFGFPEVSRASDEVISITLKKKGIFHVFGFHDYETKRRDVFYHKCANEKELLLRFVSEWAHDGYPDIVSGWNITFFDIPYLYNRIKFVLGDSDANRLSPWRIMRQRVVRTMYKEQTAINIGGVATLDYLELYQKFTYSQQESYKLDHIAYVELGERKVDHSEYETLHEFYLKDFNKFIDYNIIDTELVEKLDDKMKLIDIALTLSYDAKVTLNDIYTQVRMWDVIIHNYLHSNKVAVPISNSSRKDEAYVGAYVKDPQVGGHDWVMNFDLNSLYPHLIMQYNISPEKLVRDSRGETVKKKISIDEILQGADLNIPDDVTMAANGCFFRKDGQGFLPFLMEKMYNDRVVYKNKMIEAQKRYEQSKSNDDLKEISRYKNMQMARKIQLNSAYGALGNEHFRFFNIDQATAITLSGQLSIRWAEQELNKYMNNLLKTEDYDYVIASDTDSLYISFDKLVQKVFGSDIDVKKVVSFLDKVSSQKIEPVIDKIYQNLAYRVSAFDQKMIMKRENIANRAIWTAKKRYIMNVYDSEGVRYKEPKLKIMGIEAVKSSTPYVCRQAIITALKIIMNGSEGEVQKYISEFRDEFNKLPFDKIAFPRGVQNVTKYLNETKSVPIHVRAALVYNKKIRELKLDKKYEQIKDGEKIKFGYLKMPNPLHENVIAIISKLPSELDIEEYIDYNMQFDKAFLEPLKSILDVLNWTVEKRNTIEDFFV